MAQGAADTDYGYSSTSSFPIFIYAEETSSNCWNIHMRVVFEVFTQNNNSILQMFSVTPIIRCLGVNSVTWDRFNTRVSVAGITNEYCTYSFFGRSGLMCTTPKNDGTYTWGRVYDLNGNFGEYGYEFIPNFKGLTFNVDIYDAITT